MKTGEYKSMTLGGERVLVKSSSLEKLGKVEAVVFDCDGVLVDTRGSYDATIIRVVEKMVLDLSGLELPFERVGRELIGELRRTGGFNNDWDTTYAMTVLSMLALDGMRLRGVSAGKARDAAPARKDNEMKETLGRLRRITGRFCSSAEGIGQSAVSSFLESERLSPQQKKALSRARDYLGYPGNPPQSMMATLFDEIYHGPELFREMYGFPSRYYRGRGMIEGEKLLINRGVLEKLERVLGGKRIAMSTGRPFLAARYTLRELLDYFDPRASTYIGDADVRPELAAEYEKYRKPRGASLIRAREELASDGMLYVGDSAEDQIMVKDANRKDGRILFGAISGTARDEEEQVRYFTENGADVVMKSVRQLPPVLEAFRR